MTRKARAFALTTSLLLATDCSTKKLAVELLPGVGRPVDVLGDLVRLTLAFNTRGATGLPLGRTALIAFGIVALGVIAWQYAQLAGRDGRSAAALGLILGGAIGNLIDRAGSARGVVDFIDVGLGRYRYFTFNVADVGIVVGVALLLLSGVLRAPAAESPPTATEPT
ncbi:MAG: signal peptidase II [bacterium]